MWYIGGVVSNGCTYDLVELLWFEISSIMNCCSCGLKAGESNGDVHIVVCFFHQLFLKLGYFTLSNLEQHKKIQPKLH